MGYAIPDDNPEGRGFISVILVFFVISLFSAALRFYSRRLRKLSLDVSNYTCFVGEVSAAWLDLRSTIRLIVHEFINIGLVALLWMGKLASYHYQFPHNDTLVQTLRPDGASRSKNLR